MTNKTITIEKEFGSGDNMKKVSKSGQCQVVQTAEDVLTMLSEDAAYVPAKDATETEIARSKNRTLNLVNYALDLKFRASLTNVLNSENVDPDKATDKAAEQFMKMRAAVGKPVTLEAAKAMLASLA